MTDNILTIGQLYSVMQLFIVQQIYERYVV